MFKKTNKSALLLLGIFLFSFIYRIFLVVFDGYPSGADIGLHNSLIYSITQSENTDFFYNAYQMGGEPSLTFPGYHIFTTFIILITGMTEYLAHAIIVSLFSSFVVLSSYIMTKAVWNQSAALIVAFLAAISRFDIEMLLWGGYPNVITLLLIPVIFYLFIQKDRFSRLPFYISASILAGSLFLTHSLSTLMFIAILAPVILLSLFFTKRIGANRRNILSWFIPIILGAVLVSPFLIKSIPTYLAMNNAQDIVDATVSTRILPLEIILPLFAIFGLFFLLSKKYQGHYFTVPTILMVMWLLVPLIFTQGYLIGSYTDYNRFLYFVLMPVVILTGLFIDLGSGFFARVIDTYRALTKKEFQPKKISSIKLFKFSSKINRKLTRKNLYSLFVIGLLLFCFFFMPIFNNPLIAELDGPSQLSTITLEAKKFYQAMNDPRYEAIEWVKGHTPADSILVTDAYYGWWFSGFAQRPTWSAVDPQYLLTEEEFERAQIARNILNTAYLVDNGVIQVQEDGGYLARNNPVILAKLNWTYFPFEFFIFNSNQTQIQYEVNGALRFVYLDQLSVKDMYLEKTGDHVTIVIVRGNEYFTYTQYTTVCNENKLSDEKIAGKSFVNITATIDTSVSGVSINTVWISVRSNGYELAYEGKETVAFINEGVKAFGQLIFKESQPIVWKFSSDDYESSDMGLQYNLQKKTHGLITISATAYSVTDDLSIYKDKATVNNNFHEMIIDNLNWTQISNNTPMERVFDYREALSTNSIAYIACRYASIEMKFAKDPTFNLVFINNDAAIFEVQK